MKGKKDKSLIQNLKYFFFTSYRRKRLDKTLLNHSSYFHGKVLDIGGGKKDGKFVPPKTKSWVVVDIDQKSNPNVIASVDKLPFKDKSFDVVKATELFEHIEKLEMGFAECARVLKKNGFLVISSPFLFPLHPDPYDFQRVTLQKWKSLARENKLKMVLAEEQGYYFMLIAELLRAAIVKLPTTLRYPLYLTFPVLDLLAVLDSAAFVRNSKFIQNYVCGYFIVMKK